MNSILKVRKPDGTWVGIDAINGRSAYEYAVAGGFTGTEDQFIAILNANLGDVESSHVGNTSNPHHVTAAQVEALPITGGTLTGKTLYFDNGNARLSGGQNYMQMDVFDSQKDDNNRRKLVVNGNNANLKGAVVLTVVKDGVQSSYSVYGEHNKPSADDVGAVSKSGDTMTGALTINKPSDWAQVVMNSKSGNYRSLESDDTRVRIDVRDVKSTENRRFIDIFSNVGQTDHSHALTFAQASTTSGNRTDYILHTGNINNFVVTKGTYDGTGANTKTIPIRKTTQAVIVCGMQGTALSTMGIMVRGVNAAESDIGHKYDYMVTNNVSWADATVTVSYTTAAAPMYNWNESGVKYHYVVIG